MTKLVILVEELSMKALLDELLPRLDLPCAYQVVPHEGKSDLERSAPRKIRSWCEAPDVDVRFIVVRDNDGADCKALKQRLLETCGPTERPLLVRIVMNELEAWLLGDFEALAQAYGEPSLLALQEKAKYRNPDRLTNACELCERLTKDRGKIHRAQRVAKLMDISRNRSTSFRVFFEGVKSLCSS